MAEETVGAPTSRAPASKAEPPSKVKPPPSGRLDPSGLRRGRGGERGDAAAAVVRGATGVTATDPATTSRT